ncbi:MAG: hypothetical protein FD188_2946 [Ignavibacteria bacterium]|nr:MAG: hypothetical protein FD188_2946 [Ignavibacteria bacterium]
MVIDRGKAVMGYSDFVCTNDRFYAIYVGLPFDGNQLEGNEIHVFNMEGTLLEKIIVDHKLVYLSIDEKSRLLYGVQRNHFPKIYKIAL